MTSLTTDDLYKSPEEIKVILQNDFYNPNEHIAIMHINTRSLIKNFDLLHQLICELNREPDIILITETKLNSRSNVNFANLNNYSFFHKNSLTKAGGVGIYIKKNIQSSIRNDIKLFNKEVESLWIDITVEKYKSITIGVVYKHPNYKTLDFTEIFYEILTKLNDENRNCYILGDFNINTLEKSSNQNIKKYTNMIKSVNFHNIIKRPTRITSNSATCLDHFYTNNKNTVDKKFIITNNISDHLPLLGIIRTKHYKKKQEIRNKRNFAKLDPIMFKIDMKNTVEKLLKDLTKLPNQTIHTDFQILCNQIKEVIDKNIPRTKQSKKREKLKQKPWLTKAILKSSKTKNKMYKKLVKNNFSNKEKIQLYKSYRNKLTHLIAISKKKHYEKLLLKTNKDTKKTWNIINNVIGKTKTSTSLPTTLNTIEGKITNPNKISNKLNQHFAEVGKTDSNNIDFQNIDKYITHTQKNSFVLYETTPEEIELIIDQMKNKDSEGPDQIPMSAIKHVKEILSHILSKLINKSISSGVYPNCLKKAKVIPLYKSGDHTTLGNYRPISILSSVNKIFEKALFNRLLNFFETNRVLANNQFGFRSGHSTELAVTKFYEDILKNLNNNFASFALFLDLSKAFDCVNRKILIHKLYKYGIRGLPLNLIKSYLEDRFQYIEVENTRSKTFPTEFGVPQGSVLSPLLFLIQINDLKNSTDMEMINFADDTLIYHPINDTKNIENWINTQIQNVINWMKVNMLKLNLTKTNYMIFTPKTPKYKQLNKFKFHGNSDYLIENKSHCKYLGLIIDNRLNWKEHINNLENRLSKIVGILYKVRQLINKKSLKLIVNSLLISKLKYGILCYARASATALKPLKTRFNQSLRCINFLKRRDKSNKKLYFDEQLLNLNDMHKLEIGKFCYKFFNNLLPESFDKFFTKTSQIHNYKTRNHKIKLFRHKQLTNSGLLTLSYKGAKYWDEIPKIVKDKKSLSSFVKSLKQHLINSN